MPAGAPVTIVWPAAQRDPDVFVDPEQYREDRPAEANLLYGRGIHYCPGEGLSRLELGVFTEEFLARGSGISR
jgi:cytochrome P450